mmetsp:Transcript_21419/g.60665  ORF Transcript_21419/g.60665 Transcript_21419/m.60665 type:complete len:288 (+) Transcript_21419:104-967(+)
MRWRQGVLVHPCLAQKPRDLEEPLVHRHLHRRGAVVGRPASLRSSPEEAGSHGKVPSPGSSQQRRLAPRRRLVQRGAFLAEELDHLEAAELRGHVQRRLAVPPRPLHVGPAFAEQAHEVRPACQHGCVQGRDPAVESPVRVGASLGEDSRHLNVPAVDRHEHRGRATRALAQVLSTSITQDACYVSMPLLGSNGQRRPTFVIHAVGICRGMQSLQHCSGRSIFSRFQQSVVGLGIGRHDNERQSEGLGEGRQRLIVAQDVLPTSQALLKWRRAMLRVELPFDQFNCA